MNLASILASTTLIVLANFTPAICATDQRTEMPIDQDHLLLIFLLNRKDFDMKTKPIEEAAALEYSTLPLEGGRRSGLTRDKRIGSLSIVDSVDVLRERVLLELARRKAMEDQMQMDQNRRVLNNLGKRSSPPLAYYRDHRSPRKKRLQPAAAPMH